MNVPRASRARALRGSSGQWPADFGAGFATGACQCAGGSGVTLESEFPDPGRGMEICCPAALGVAGTGSDPLAGTARELQSN